MSEREVWDAYNSKGDKLGIDLYRDEYSKIPKNVYHLVVIIYSITNDGEILITRRAPSKITYPLKWEVTGGAVLKDETPIEGAVRELQEETGIQRTPDELIEIYSGSVGRGSGLYYCYANFIDKDNTKIVLQEGETVDYDYISYEEFKKFIYSEEFCPMERRRFLSNEAAFDNLMFSLNMQK